jgi:hypothetical protein
VSWKLRRHQDHADRELTRDEVFVPEVYGGYLGERNRDMSYIQYVLIRRTGLVGRLFAAVSLITLLTVLFGWWFGVSAVVWAWLYGVVGVLFVVMIAVYAVQPFLRRRRRIEQARQPDAH